MKKKFTKIVSVSIVVLTIFSIISFVYASQKSSVAKELSLQNPKVSIAQDSIPLGSKLDEIGPVQLPMKQKNTINSINNSRETSKTEYFEMNTKELDIKQTEKIKDVLKGKTIKLQKQEPIQKDGTPIQITNSTKEERILRRENKLNMLKEAYPDEYKIIQSKVEDPIYQVALLEIINYWEIDNIIEFVDAFIAEGYKGIEKYLTQMRDWCERE